MRKQILLALPLVLCYVACYRDIPVVQRVTRVEHDKIVVRKTCLQVAPPSRPVELDCASNTLLGLTDCEDVNRARWSDYGREVEEWVRLYAWPRCQIVDN